MFWVWNLLFPSQGSEASRIQTFFVEICTVIFQNIHPIFFKEYLTQNVIFHVKSHVTKQEFWGFSIIKSQHLMLPNATKFDRKWNMKWHIFKKIGRLFVNFVESMDSVLLLRYDSNSFQNILLRIATRFLIIWFLFSHAGVSNNRTWQDIFPKLINAQGRIFLGNK